MPKFHELHYNFVAKRIRENFPLREGNTSVAKIGIIAARGAITVLALDFAKSFKKDSDSFDPLRFLDRCSPDVDTYPLSELLEVTHEADVHHKES